MCNVKTVAAEKVYRSTFELCVLELLWHSDCQASVTLTLIRRFGRIVQNRGLEMDFLGGVHCDLPQCHAHYGECGRCIAISEEAKLNNPIHPKSSISPIVSLLLVLIAYNGWACSCMRDTIEEEFQESEIVFSGKVLSADKPTKGPYHGNQLVEFEFELEVDWKGELENKLTVSTELLSMSCGYPFQVGTSYVVFASSTKVHVDDEGNEFVWGFEGPSTADDDYEKLYTGWCHANKKIDKSRESRVLLRKLKALKSKNEKESPDENARQTDEQED